MIVEFEVEDTPDKMWDKFSPDVVNNLVKESLADAFQTDVDFIKILKIAKENQ